MSLSEPIFQFKENLLQHFNWRRLGSKWEKKQEKRGQEDIRKNLFCNLDFEYKFGINLQK